MKTVQELYNELAYYTLSLGDEEFIHQHIVDAFGAQNAGEKTKPIGICFALAGLYLYLEKDYTGRQVQLAHMQMAKKRKKWPALELPENRGDITIADVLDAEPGEERREMIRKWCDSVWKAYSQSHDIVAALVNVVLYG
ncbi:MAG: hypothetical protein JXA96_09870 [Sedimentisphaerales bacterium]|nr:hypothetical protein [Sedimentisphaerales bacterium]